MDEYSEFHDKLEFEIAPTAFDFEFDRNIPDRCGEYLPYRGIEQLRGALFSLTNNLLDLGTNGSLARAEQVVNLLEHRQLARGL